MRFSRAYTIYLPLKTEISGGIVRISCILSIIYSIYLAESYFYRLGLGPLDFN